MAVPEGDEHPDEFGVRVAGELKDEREWPLGCGRVDDGEIQLCAAGELRRVWTKRLAGQQIGERDAVLFDLGSTACGDLKRAAGEAADRVAPDGLIEAHRQAPRAVRPAQRSAFAVSRRHVIGERLQLLSSGRAGAQPRVHGIHRGRRADVE